MEIGRKIYYDKITGRILVDTGERSGDVRETTTEDDFASYVALTERVPDTVGCIQLEYGQYAQDFAECNSYRVNSDKAELEFSYPNPSDHESQEPIYRKPLSVEVDELKQENALLKAQNNALSDRADFIEDVIAELATQLYQ